MSYGTAFRLLAGSGTALLFVVGAALAPAALATQGQAPAAVPAPAQALPLQAPPLQATGTAQPATFGIGPEITANAQQRPYFSYSATPNARALDGVSIGNLSYTPLTLSIYPTDLINDSDGSTSFGVAGVKPTHEGSWITLQNAVGQSPVTVSVQARSTATIPLTLSVPASASPGDHESGIVASLIGFARNANGDIVRLDQRVGTRAFIRVSGKLVAKVAVTDIRPVYHQNYNPLAPGSVTVRYTITNTGNVKVGVSARVSFSGLFGTSASARGAHDIPLLMPGASAQVTVSLPRVWPEILGTAHVTAVPRAVLGDNDPPMSAARGSAWTWTLPLTLLIILVVLVGGYWYRRRRRKKGSPEVTADGVPQAPESPSPDVVPVASSQEPPSGSSG